MNLIQAILGCFEVLRQRGVRDPLYCRLLLNDGRRDTRGWLWRDPSRVGRNIATGETLVLSMEGRPSCETQITWQPLFRAAFSGCTETEERRAKWFLHSGPKVTGGTHQSLDDFRGEGASWDLPARDFYLVRCGSYTHRNARHWRHPSDEAIDWVNDPRRFLVDDRIRRRVAEALSEPLPTGEWLTIRRIFDAQSHKACGGQNTLVSA